MSSPALQVMTVCSLQVAEKLISEGWRMRSAYKNPDGSFIMMMTRYFEDYPASAEEASE